MASLQETWMEGEEVMEKMDDYPGWTLLRHGLKEKVCARGSQGVGILLSPPATAAWTEAGAQMLSFGPRIVSTRLRVKDNKARPLTIYVVSAYAPLASAPKAERDRYKFHVSSTTGSALTARSLCGGASHRRKLPGRCADGSPVNCAASQHRQYTCGR